MNKRQMNTLTNPNYMYYNSFGGEYYRFKRPKDWEPNDLRGSTHRLLLDPNNKELWFENNSSKSLTEQLTDDEYNKLTEFINNNLVK